MWHVWVSSFGVVSAILVVGGYVLLQWQRNYYRFQLTKAALECGITDSPAGPPYWLISFRQGIMILALGIGLLTAGGVAYALASGVPAPEMPELQSTVVTAEAEVATTDPGKPAAKPPHPRSSRPDPAHERWDRGQKRWERAQNQQTVGLATMGCGLVVTLLGAVRTGFARVERRHSSDRS